MIKNNSLLTDPDKSVESLTAQLHHRDEELAVINGVQEALAAQLSMQGIYKLVGEKIREIFNAQVIDIVTYDSEKNLIEDQYAYEKGETTLLGPREPSGFRKHIIQSHRLLLLNNDIEKYSLQYNNPVVVGELPKSAVLVPLISSGEVTGIISLQNLDQENAFSESDVNLLCTGRRAASARESAEKRVPPAATRGRRTQRRCSTSKSPVSCDWSTCAGRYPAG